MKKKRVYKAEEQGKYSGGMRMVVMPPVVINESSSSENVASEGIGGSEGEVSGERAIERFGDFDNREDGG